MDKTKGYVGKSSWQITSIRLSPDDIYVEEIPENAVRADGIVGQDLVTGVLFVTSEALKGDLKRLDEVDIIIIPRDR